MDLDTATQTAIGTSVAALLGALARWVQVRGRERRRERRERVVREIAKDYNNSDRPTPVKRRRQIDPPICELSDPPPSAPPPKKGKRRDVE